MHTENETNRVGLLIASFFCLTFGTGTVLTYLKTARNEIVRSAAEQTPAAFDLERLKILSNDVLPHIARHQQSVERLRLLILGYEKQIREIESKQASAKEEMVVLRGSLDASEPVLNVGVRVYSRQDIANDLNRRLNVYEREENSLQQKKEHLRQLSHLLDKAVLAIDALSERRQALIAQHDQLKARLLAADLEATALPSDETAIGFAVAEELATEIETKIAGRLALVPSETGGRIAVDVTRPPETRYDSLFKTAP